MWSSPRRTWHRGEAALWLPLIILLFAIGCDASPTGPVDVEVMGFRAPGDVGPVTRHLDVDDVHTLRSPLLNPRSEVVVTINDAGFAFSPGEDLSIDVERGEDGVFRAEGDSM